MIREEDKSLNKTVVCKCPRCGKKHKKSVFFVGRGVPRYYCSACAVLLERGRIGEQGMDPVRVNYVGHTKEMF